LFPSKPGKKTFFPNYVPTLKIQDLAPQEAVRAVAETSEFRSREPAAVEPKKKKSSERQPRHYRTGRNVQLNVKARQEAIDEFYRISDEQKWVLGKTFERAMAALRRELRSRTPSG
jgi:hypothetical protein